MVVRIARRERRVDRRWNVPEQNFPWRNGPRLAATNSTLKKVVWQLRDDGWLQCDYTYAAEGTNDFFGVVFDYPENLVKAKRWLGDGPYRVWKNRLRGADARRLGKQIQQHHHRLARLDLSRIQRLFCRRALAATGHAGRTDHRRAEERSVCAGADAGISAGQSGGQHDSAAAAVRARIFGRHSAHWQHSSRRRTPSARKAGSPVAHGEYSGSVSFYFGKLP